MTTMTRTRHAADAADNLADHAAQRASDAIRSTQGATNAAFERMNESVETAREHASPLLDRWTSQAEEVARRSAAAVRDSSALLRERAALAANVTSSRIQDDPLKSVLIAAAAGAVLMAVFGLLRRRDYR